MKLCEQYPYITTLVSDIYLPFCNTETGDYSFFLFQGDALDQPYCTNHYLSFIKLNYKLYIKEQREKETERLRSKSRGKRRGL